MQPSARALWGGGEREKEVKKKYKKKKKRAALPRRAPARCETANDRFSPFRGAANATELSRRVLFPRHTACGPSRHR